MDGGARGEALMQPQEFHGHSQLNGDDWTAVAIATLKSIKLLREKDNQKV